MSQNVDSRKVNSEKIGEPRHTELIRDLFNATHDVVALAEAHALRRRSWRRGSPSPPISAASAGFACWRIYRLSSC
jgi:hypothetical protein